MFAVGHERPYLCCPEPVVVNTLIQTVKHDRKDSTGFSFSNPSKTLLHTITTSIYSILAFQKYQQ